MLDNLPPVVLGFIIGRHMGYLLQDRTVNTHVVIFFETITVLNALFNQWVS